MNLTVRIGQTRMVALRGALFRKALRISLAMGTSSTGQIANLMSNDAAKIRLGSSLFQNFWYQPVLIAIALALLWQFIGASSVVGIAIMAAFVPVQIAVSRRLIRVRRATMKKTDRRVQSCHELITLIRTIKLLAWERPLAAKLSAVRREELALTRKLLAIRAFNFLPVVIRLLS